MKIRKVNRYILFYWVEKQDVIEESKTGYLRFGHTNEKKEAIKMKINR